MNKDYVVINDRAYDPITGMPRNDVIIPTAPVDSAAKAKAERGSSVAHIHKSHAQASTTLNRRYVKHPVTASAVIHASKPAPIIARHQAIQRFAVQPVAAPVQAVRADRPAVTHPVVTRSRGRQMDMVAPRQKRAENQKAIASIEKAPVVTAAPKPAVVLKNEAIHEVMSREVAAQKTRRQKPQKSTFSRWLSVASAGFAIMLLGGYFTYLSMPNISIRVAAVQSGIDAKYPGYQPNGYDLRGPIAFKDGEVRMKFAYAGGEQQYTLTQKKSGWDSSAVKNYATKNDESPTTTIIDGLTIYTYGSNAAWVNGGILYTIDGDAPLSGEQVRKIATSM